MSTRINFHPRYMSLIFICFLGIQNIKAQDWQWAKKAGGLGFEHGQHISVDKKGGLYLSGTFELTADFGDTLNSKGHSDIFVAKYDTSGNWLWSKQINGTGRDYCMSMSRNAENIYLAGFYEHELHFDSVIIRGDKQDIFIANYDTEGQLKWVKTFGGPGFDGAYGVDTDKHGNIYMTGVFADSFKVDTFQFYQPRWRGVFLLKMDKEGEVQWLKASSGRGNMLVNAIDVDETDHIYITGEYAGKNVIGTDTIEGQKGIYTAKFDSNGEVLWLSEWGDKGIFGFGGDVLADTSGIYVCGAYQGIGRFGDDLMTALGETDIFLTKLDPSTGQIEWLERAGGFEHDKGMGLLLHNEKLYMTGWYDAESNFGDTTLTASGGNNFFITEYSKNGQVNWVQAPIQQGLAYGKALTADEDNNIYFTGWFTRILNFPTALLRATGEADVFLGKYKLPDKN